MPGAAHSSGPIGRSLTGRNVVLTGNEGCFDASLTQGLEAAGACVTVIPAKTQPDAAFVEALLDEIERAKGKRVDILINNRRDRHLGPAESTEFARWRATQSFLVDAAFLFTTAFARRLIAAGEAGVILTLVDAIVMQGSAGATGAGAASAALANLTKGWAVEWATDGIRANVLGFSLWDEPGDPLAAIAAKTGVALGDTTPLGRAAAAEDIVNMALYLCSPYAAYITGSTMIVDGGEGLRHTLGGPAFDAPRTWLPR